MKNKTGITLMICTAANRDKIPIVVVGNAANPMYFRGMELSLPYVAQKNAWFDNHATLVVEFSHASLPLQDKW